MGEFSKRIGDVGEKVVSDFLEAIGWKNASPNFDFPSIDPVKHERSSGKHGIDRYFHYLSPMISGTVEHALISSKYSTNSYPTSPNSDFKNHYFDLATAIESFKRSQILQESIRQYEWVDTNFVRGVLFWLNNQVKDGYDDLYPKIANAEVAKDIRHDGILVMDRRRVQFIYDSLNYARLIDRDARVDFIYFLTGLNNQDIDLRNGPILPVQMLTTGILPLRLQKKTGETTIIISSIDSFEEENLVKLIGLAKNISCNLQVKTDICYPDYLESLHLPIVNRRIQTFGETGFTSGLTVSNYANPIFK